LLRGTLPPRTTVTATVPTTTPLDRTPLPRFTGVGILGTGITAGGGAGRLILKSALAAGTRVGGPAALSPAAAVAVDVFRDPLQRDISASGNGGIGNGSGNGSGGASGGGIVGGGGGGGD
jgi:hypothetical protein